MEKGAEDVAISNRKSVKSTKSLQLFTNLYNDDRKIK